MNGKLSKISCLLTTHVLSRTWSII